MTEKVSTQQTNNLEQASQNTENKTQPTTESTQPDAESKTIKQSITLQNFPKEISVKFVTTAYPVKVTETPFKVPSDLTRFGLSEIINHLLGHTKPTPFEFLIEHNEKRVFLRTSLKQFFVKHQIWPETDIILEYLEAEPAPKSVDSIPHDDWVSAIQYIPNDSASLIITGCYDGLCRVINENGEIITSAKHKKPVKFVKAFKDNNGQVNILVALKDQNIRYWKYLPDEKKCKLHMILKGHTECVEWIDINSKKNMAVSCGADKMIRLWQIEGKVDPVNPTEQPKTEEGEPTPKKKKTIDKRKLERAAIGMLEGHQATVSSVIWDEERLVSGSYDHTIRLWDVVKAKNISTITGNKVVHAIDLNKDRGLIISAHPDHIVRLWDSRSQNNKASQFKSHKGWVRCVQWCPNPEKQYQFASAGDDNLIKIWDIRSTIPLHSIPHSTVVKTKDEMYKEKRTQPYKVLSMLWVGAEKSMGKIYSGSSDCQLKKHVFSG